MSKKKIVPQAQWIHDFNNDFRPKFNDTLFHRDHQDIVEELSKVIYSCQKDNYFTLKVMSIETITDYEEVYNTLRDHYESRKKKSDKRPNPYDYINIKDSSIILLKVKYFIQKNGIERMKVNGKDMDVENPSRILEVLIELPRYVNKYYFRLQGNYYNSIYQIVDGSTYNNSTTSNSKNDVVTLKTLFMSVRIYRMFKDILDINSKEKIHCMYYNSLIFKNMVNTMYYHLAKYGLYATFELFHIYGIIISKEPVTDPNYYCFKKYNLYVAARREIFDNEPIIQAMCVSLVDGILKDTKYEDLFTWEYWLLLLGIIYKHPTVDKGLFVLQSLEGIYDWNTRDSIHLPEEDKKNIYLVLKWLICQFSELKAKDNVDVSIKRVRIAEYIAHTYAMKLTRGIHRISDLGKKVKLKQIVAAIYTQPQFIISKIILQSNLISYVDLVNDNDATRVLEWTYKGISGLGEDGGKVMPIYRFVDASHLGIFDLDTSSNSDPGMTGMLCPMTNITNNSFTDYEEPNDWDKEFAARKREYEKLNKKKIPFVYDKEYKYEFDYEYINKEMIARSLDVGKKQCPLIDLDGKIDYRYSLDEQPVMPDPNEEEVDTGSIFDIIEEGSSENKESSNNTDTSDNEDDGNKEEFIYVPYIV